MKIILILLKFFRDFISDMDKKILYLKKLKIFKNIQNA